MTGELLACAANLVRPGHNGRRRRRSGDRTTEFERGRRRIAQTGRGRADPARCRAAGAIPRSVRLHATRRCPRPRTAEFPRLPPPPLRVTSSSVAPLEGMNAVRRHMANRRPFGRERVWGARRHVAPLVVVRNWRERDSGRRPQSRLTSGSDGSPTATWMLARADSGHVFRDLRAPSWTTGRVGRVSRKALGSGLPSDHERLSPGVSEVRGARVPACDQSGRGGAQLDHGLVRRDPARAGRRPLERSYARGFTACDSGQRHTPWDACAQPSRELSRWSSAAAPHPTSTTRESASPRYP